MRCRIYSDLAGAHLRLADARNSTSATESVSGAVACHCRSEKVSRELDAQIASCVAFP